MFNNDRIIIITIIIVTRSRRRRVSPMSACARGDLPSHNRSARPPSPPTSSGALVNRNYSNRPRAFRLEMRIGKNFFNDRDVQRDSDRRRCCFDVKNAKLKLKGERGGGRQGQ